jgi:hypothetical protein
LKSVIALFGVGLFLLFLGVAMMPALSSFRGVPVDAPYNITLVGSDNTTATVTLANDVLDDNKVNITALSTNENDAPVPFTYTANNRHLTVTGLQQNASRTLTLTYKVARLDGATDMAARFLPTFLIIAAIAVVAGAAKSAWDNSHGG